MKKILMTIICCILLAACGNENTQTYGDKPTALKNVSAVPKIERTSNEKSNLNVYQPMNYQVQKGIWISYIDLAPMLTGTSEKEFTQNFDTACKNVSGLGFNTIYVHLRPFGDALYDSKLFQKSKYLSDSQDFDPLKIMTEVAHKYKLSFHGWINPLRCETAENLENTSDSYQIKKWYKNMDSSDIIGQVEGDGHLWLNPAYEEVRNLIAEGAKEIAENYDVDGIHYDDYFYPTTDKSFDEQCFSEKSGNQSLDEWRMDNISQMCAEIYSAVKSVNIDISVGISPQGNIENNYNYMYADVKKWGSQEGYADYIVPQIYFGYENESKPFEQTLKDWQDIVTCEKVSLVPGLGAYKIMSDSEFEENRGIIAEQISDCLDKYKCTGAAVYTYGSLFTPEEKFASRIAAENKLISSELKSEI